MKKRNNIIITIASSLLVIIGAIFAGNTVKNIVELWYGEDKEDDDMGISI